MVLYPEFLQRLRREVAIPLHRKPKLAANGFQLGKRESSQLRLNPEHQAEEDILAVKLRGVPCPSCIGGKELYPCEGFET